MAPISLDLLLSNLPGMAYRCRNDSSWTMEFVSAGATELTGYQAEELIGNRRCSYGNLIHPDDRDWIWNDVQKCLAQRSAIEVTYRIVTADSEHKWVCEQAKAIRDEHGELVALEGFITDVTAIKEAEEKLRESEERFRNVANVVTDAMWDWDMEHGAIWWNEGMQSLLGLSSMPSTSDIAFWYAHVHPDDQGRIAHQRSQIMRNDEAVWHAEYRLRSANGSYAHVLDKALILRDASGKAIRMTGGTIDLSERKKHEEETRRQLRTQSGIVELLRQITTPGLDLPGIVELVAERVQILTQATGSAVELLDKNAIIYCAASGSASDQVGMRLSMTQSLSRFVFQHGETIYCEDTETDERIDREACLRINARSMVIVPLRSGEAIVGAVKIFSDRPRAFSIQDCSNLRIVVESLGTIMQRHSALEQLQASEAQYRLLFDNNPHPMWVYDAGSLRILAVNHAAIHRYGHSEQEFLNLTMHSLYASNDTWTIEANLKKAQRIDRLPTLAEHRKKDGTVIDVELSSDKIVFNQAPAVLALASDVTGRLQAERSLALASEKLHHLAFYDPLTLLPNRLLLMDRLQQAVTSNSAESILGVLLYLDLDNFKAINDTFGRDAGDALVQEVAARLNACVESGATVARLDADEFAVMLPKIA